MVTKDLTSHERRNLINQLENIDKDYKRKLSELVEPRRTEILSQDLDYYEEKELLEDLYFEKSIELMSEYEQMILDFFNRNDNINLYVHDI